ncbi:MAG: hypothetical protein AB2L09_11435 [Coriobacteriia bacterium]
MSDEPKNAEAKEAEEAKAEETEKEEVKAPVSEICGKAQANAAAAVGDDSEVKPVQGFFLTSQRWH